MSDNEGTRIVSAPVTLDDWLRVRPDLHRVGSEHHGACPSCGGRDRFRVLDNGAAFCRQCAPAGDADGKAIKRLQHDAGLQRAAGLNGAAPVIRRLPLGGVADKVTQHEIRDTAGKLQAVHVRTDRLIGKDLKWASPDGKFGLAGRKLATLPLYRSEDVPRAAQCTALVLTEGEKAADALRAAEPTLLVLGTVTGAQSIPAPEVLQTVVDAALPIYLWPDADDEGAAHMQRVGDVLHAAGAKPLVIDAPPDTKGARCCRLGAADGSAVVGVAGNGRHALGLGTGACDRAAEGEEETAVRRLPRGAGNGTGLVHPYHVRRRARLVLPFE